MNSEETEQLAGRSRSRLPPFGRRYAKPPAAALLTGQVARELASTLTRLRLVRSSHLPWPLRASCRIPGHHGAAGGGASLTALANGLELGFVVPRQAHQAWAVTSPSRQHAGSRFPGCCQVVLIGAKIGTRTSITEVQPPNWFGGHHLLWLEVCDRCSREDGAVDSSSGRRDIDRATFGRKICAATCYAAIFNLVCSSDQYSMSKRSASLIGVKQP